MIAAKVLQKLLKHQIKNANCFNEGKKNDAAEAMDILDFLSCLC